MQKADDDLQSLLDSFNKGSQRRKRKRRKREVRSKAKADKSSKPDPSPGRVSVSVGNRIRDRLERHAQGRCLVSKALVGEVGECSFCSVPPSPDHVLLVTGHGKKSKTQVRICRTCASLVASERLEL